MTNEQAKTEMMQIYGSLSEEKKMALDVLMSQADRDAWQELKETITEMRDNDGTGTQQEVCKFLVNYMNVLEKQMVEPQERSEK